MGWFTSGKRSDNLLSSDNATDDVEEWLDQIEKLHEDGEEMRDWASDGVNEIEMLAEKYDTDNWMLLNGKDRGQLVLEWEK